MPVGHFVGAMPPELFLEDFMKPTDTHSPAPCADFSRVPLKNLVPDMCKALVQAVEEAKSCPGLRLFRTRTKKQWLDEVKITSNHSYSSEFDDEDGEQSKYLYQYGRFPALAARIRPRPRKGMKKEVDIIETYDYASALLDIEVQDRLEADPFADPEDDEAPTLHSAPRSVHSHPDVQKPELPSESLASKITPPLPPLALPLGGSGLSHLPHQDEASLGIQQPPTRQKSLFSSQSKTEYYELFENPSPESAAFRASLILHAASQFTRRHRVFFFQVVIFDRWARFIRWDRSGAISTRRFDYVSRPHVLSEFFWRFSHLTDGQRGLDPTITPANVQETRLFKDAAGIKDGVPRRTLPNAELVLEDAKTWPVWKVHVVDAKTSTSTDLVVGRPLSDSCCVFGRATRAYIAYDLKEQRLVFLKDTWRADHPKLFIESETYRDLKKHKVPHIPNVLYGGDVRVSDHPPQDTSTQIYAEVEDEWRVTNYSYARFVHHCVVQGIAYPLESSLDVREFLQVLHDVLMAVSDAYEKAGLLHRDLSIGNVMIDHNGRGVLNDWDHAGYKHELARGVGTWRFMSVPLLADPDKLHDIADDLESIHWVLVFGSLKLFALAGQDMPLRIFDWQGVNENGRRIGGDLKRGWIRNSAKLNAFRLTSPDLHKFIRDSQVVWLRFYYALEGDLSDSDDEDSRARAANVLASVTKPSFWIDKYAAVLRFLDEKQAGTKIEPSTLDFAGPSKAGGPSVDGNAAGPSTVAPAPAQTTQQTELDVPPMRDFSNTSPTNSADRKRRTEDDVDHNAPLTRSKRRKLGL